MAQDKNRAKEGQFTVVDLSRSQLTICNTSSTGPSGFKFPPEVVKDLEVVNPSQLEALIKTFITKHQPPPTPLIIILAPDVYFEKDLTGSESERVAQVQEFLDAVPLLSASFKIFKVQNSQRLIVINRNLYESVKRSFEEQGFKVVAVTPAAVLADTKISNQLSAQSYRLILRKVDYIKQNSFLAEPAATDFHQKQQKFFKAHQTMLGILSVVSVVFSVAMGTILVRRPTNRPASAFQPPASPQTTTTPLTTTSPPASPSANFSQLSLTILNGSGTGGKAAELEEKLKPLGFASIHTGNTPARPSQTLITFSQSVTAVTRSVIIDSIKQLYPNLSNQESSQIQSDVIITIGQISPWQTIY